MRTSTVKLEISTAKNITITEDALIVDLRNGRTIPVPLAWYPRLLHASQKDCNNWRLIEKGQCIHCGDIDEDISVAGLLAGKPSGESQASFKKWLEGRISRVT